MRSNLLKPMNFNGFTVCAHQKPIRKKKKRKKNMKKRSRESDAKNIEQSLKK